MKPNVMIKLDKHSSSRAWTMFIQKMFDLYAYVGVAFLLIVALFSCDNNTEPILQSKSFVATNEVFDTLRGTLSDIAELGASKIYAYDTLLFVESMNPESQLHVYSLNTLQNLANLCSKGRSKPEFINPSNPSNQVYKVDNHFFIKMKNMNSKDKVIDITESIIHQRTIIAEEETGVRLNEGSKLEIPSFNTSLVYSGVGYDDPRDAIFEPPKFAWHYKNGDHTEIPVFDNVVNVTQSPLFPIVLYKGGLRLSPDERTAVYYFICMNYMFIFDVENKSAFSLYKEGEQRFGEIFPDDPSTINVGYGDICLTNDYILALCPNGSEADYDDPNKRPLIRVFTIAGEYLDSRTLDYAVFNIAWDNDNKLLYGLDAQERIYCYNLHSLFEGLDNK